jgi:putative transposase
MKRGKFHEEQSIGILEEKEAGMVAADVYSPHGNSEAKFCDLQVTEARRLRAQEAENANAKELLAEAMLDIAVLKVILAKK